MTSIGWFNFWFNYQLKDQTVMDTSYTCKVQTTFVATISDLIFVYTTLYLLHLLYLLYLLCLLYQNLKNRIIERETLLRYSFDEK